MTTKTKTSAKKPAKKAAPSKARIPILVTTQHRGVFFGYVPKSQDLTKRTMALLDARMAIYWGTEKGVMQLAATGPTSKSQIGARADIPVLHDITGVFAVSPEAVEKWASA